MADAIQALKARIHGLVERGSVVLSTASSKLQSLQLKIAGEPTDDDLEHFEPYGFTSRPKDPVAVGADAGAAEAIALALGGNRDHQIVICVADRRYRMVGLEKGEVAIFDDQGAAVVLKRARIQIISNVGDTVEVSDDGAALVATDGVVHGSGIDPYTGSTYFVLGNTSARLLAKK